MGGHDLTLNKVEHTHAPASQTTTAFLTLDNKHVVSPERRLHHPQNLLTCETALQVFSDGSILQVTLGDPASEQGWYVHATLDPGVLWIWIGAFLMALGGATTALRKRFFKNPKPGNGPQAESPQRIPSKRGET